MPVWAYLLSIIDLEIPFSAIWIRTLPLAIEFLSATLTLVLLCGEMHHGGHSLYFKFVTHTICHLLLNSTYGISQKASRFMAD